MPYERLYPLREIRVRLKVMEGEPLYSTAPVDSPQKAADLVTRMLGEMDREYVCLANLDTRAVPLSYHIVTIGGLDLCQAPIANIFKAAILENAGSIILFHNHPSGDPAPSEPDKELTRKVVEAGDLMGIPVLDHVIVGGGTRHLYSFREHMPELFRNEAFMWSRERKAFQEPSLKYADGKKSVIKTLKAADNRVGRNMPNKKALGSPER